MNSDTPAGPVPPAVSTALSFEDRYRVDPDPWNFAGSDYERERYRSLIEALPRPRYGRAFEPGCSVGELTAQLAGICAQIIATDVSPTAVARATRRCADLENVDIRCADVAVEVPPGSFDLIVFSELGYYFPVPTLLQIARSMVRHLDEGGDFVAAHWLGESPDHVLHGDTVHEELIASLPLSWLGGRRHAGFRIDCWRRA